MSNHRDRMLQLAESIIGYQMQQPEQAYLWEALQIAGSGEDLIGGRVIKKGNQRLAVVGDAYSRAALSEDWWAQGGSKGDWTKLYNSLLENKNLAKIALDTGLFSCMNFNPNNPVPYSEGLAATLVEAVMGAVYLDGGMVVLRKVMRSLEISSVIDTNSRTASIVPYAKGPRGDYKPESYFSVMNATSVEDLIFWLKLLDYDARLCS